ncbi:hypothetical protein HMPREF1579_01362 [Gardnerella vaginalis JCP8066]|nr:hypothetical protein HMPREF1579_01362 [Gardnerella vaginalis JCP8066]
MFQFLIFIDFLFLIFDSIFNLMLLKLDFCSHLYCVIATKLCKTRN